MDLIYEKKTLIDNGVEIEKNYNDINKLISIETKNAQKINEVLKKNILHKKKVTDEEFKINLEQFLNNDIDENSIEQYKMLVQNINYLSDKYKKDKSKIKLLVKEGKKIKLQKIK